MRIRHDCPIALALVNIYVISVADCSDGSQRKAVEGTVTLDGRPLAKGSISFQPQPGSSSPSAGAEIIDGRFSIGNAQGPCVGKFRVEITASHASGRRVADRLGGKPIDEYVQYLPSKYNTDSALTIEVKNDELNHFDFPLVTK